MSSSGNGAAVLRTEELVKRFGRKEVVRHVTIELKKGEVVGLLGPNGAGKTTTFFIITGMIRPTSGEIYLDGERLTKLPMYRRARKGIGYLSQEASIFRRLTVEENLRIILETLPLSREEGEAKLEVLLQELSIEHLRKRKGYTLSGGERRRTEISRALVTDPSFMLLDEPFAGIDPIAVEDIQRIVQDLKARGIGVLITDHNVHETLSITDRAYLLYEGEILISGSAESLAEDPEARALYLGEKFRLER